MNLFKSCVLGSVMMVAGLGTAQAQAWPPATVRIVVPYPAGTEPDVLARDLGNALAKQTGKTFVVDNKPGANSIIGTDAVAKSEPDGATLLMVDRLALVTNKERPYTDIVLQVHDLQGLFDQVIRFAHPRALARLASSASFSAWALSWGCFE